jgi:hypothetical protein
MKLAALRTSPCAFLNAALIIPVILMRNCLRSSARSKGFKDTHSSLYLLYLLQNSEQNIIIYPSSAHLYPTKRSIVQNHPNHAHATLKVPNHTTNLNKR